MTDLSLREPAPLLSVLMPVFNAAPFVVAAVDSVLNQTFGDFEFIVVDDGSTDSSLQLLRSCAGRDKRIRLVAQANRGLIGTLNRMLSMARGSLLARMDADDLCYPERFATQVAFLQNNPAVVAVGSRALLIDSDGLPLMEAMGHFSHEQIDRALLKTELGMVHPSVMMRAAACRSIGGYKEAYKHAEDLDFFSRMAEVGELANISQPLLKYRMHVSSVSHKHVVLQSDSALRAVRDTFARRGLDESEIDIRVHTATESRAELHRKWTWWALNAGHVRTARKHAMLALIAEPFHQGNGRLMACVLRDSLKRWRAPASEETR